MKDKRRIISHTVLLLSMVSLFTDIASEMLYPIMPLYLKEIGFSVIGIGILEGFAEAVAGLSKGYFGAWSDQTGKRVPFIRWGYSLSALSKPMMAVFTFPLWIFFARTIDRVGKGLRTGARDAVLAEEATPETKGRVFGFHRSMDTLGAMLGPALALAFLYFYPQKYRSLFLWALIPGVIAVVTTLLLKKEKSKPKQGKHYPSFKAFFQYFSTASPSYKQLVAALLFFTLFNSSDVFLLLKMKTAGLSDTALIGVYIFYNGVYALLAYPLGSIADKFGLKKVFLTGLFFFAIVYAGMSISSSVPVFMILFFLYGLYAAATEGISKAWITQIIHNQNTATAIGTFTGFQSIATMLASALAGWLWYEFGPAVTFLSSAIVTLLVILYIQFKIPSA
ncbi:MAG: MFS transporter [Ilyomonas sp.]